MKIGIKFLAGLLAVALLTYPFSTLAAEGGHEIHGSVFFGGAGFDYSEHDLFHLERYGTNRDGDKGRGGYVFFDAFDINLYLSNLEDDTHTLDISRDSFNYFDQRFEGRINTDEFKFEVGGTVLESFVQDPVPRTDPTYGGVNGASYVAVFNNDADPDTIDSGFSIERDSYAGTITIKPQAYGHDGSIVGDLEFYYRGYDRSGKRFFRYVFGGSDRTGGNANNGVRWRGLDQEVDENVDVAGVRTVLAPFNWFTLTNDTSVEVYDNHVLPVSTSDINFLFEPTVRARGRTINFLADTTKITTTTEFLTSIDHWLTFRAGYTYMNLDQNTFSHSLRDGNETPNNEHYRQYLTGRTDHHIATTAIALMLADWWTVTTHGRWTLRDNRSSIDDSTAFHTLLTIIDPRIDQISTVEGTLETTLRMKPWRTNVNGGWTRKRTNRDLQFKDQVLIQGVGDEHMLTSYSLYSSNTTQDTFFIYVTTHPAQGWTGRVKSSFTTSSDTGLITEPTTGWSANAIISYYDPVLYGFNVSVHGGIKDFENDDKAFVDVSGASFPVDHDGTTTTAGGSATINPVEGTSLFATYTYISNDFDTTFHRTNIRRFLEPENVGLNVLFTKPQSINYDDHTHSFSGGFTQRITDWWTLSGSYVFTISEGENTSGPMAAVYLEPTDNKVDHLDHIAMASSEIKLGEGYGVVGEYTFEGFEDDEDHANDGHINAFMLSLYMTR